MSNVVVEKGAGSLRRISWGAIIAGTILALVVQIMLGLFGIGIGLATVDPATGGTPDAGTMGTAGGIYATLAILVATFVGGYAAARFSGVYQRRDAALHGITTWAVATLVAVYLISSGAASIVTGTFGALGSTVSGLGSAVSAAAPDSLDALPPQLQNQLRDVLAQGEQQAQQTAQQATDQAQQAAQQAQAATGTQNVGAALREIFAGLQEDATPEERNAALTVISQQAGISQAEAEQRLNGLQSEFDQFMAQARQTAEEAASAVSGAAFATFVGMLLGAIVGALGGIVGRVERVHELYR